MRDAHVDTKSYREMLDTLIIDSQQGCLSIGLNRGEFSNLSIDNKIALCDAMSRNTYYTQYFFDHCVIDNAFVILLRNTLEKNTTITTLSFHPPLDTPKNILDDIATFLKRNRERALNKPLTPPVLASVTSQFKGLHPLAIFKIALNAAKSGDVNLIHTCITHEPSFINFTKSDNVAQQTLLTVAAQQGRVQCVKYLLKAGADVDPAPIDKMNCTASPLFVAVENSHYVVAELLIAAGANVNALDTLTGCSVPLRISDSDIATLLVRHNADVNVTLKVPGFHSTGTTILHCIAHTSTASLQLLEQLLQLTNVVNQQDFKGNTPLHMMLDHNVLRSTGAALGQQMTLFLKAGANPLLKNKLGQTPADMPPKQHLYKQLVINLTKDYAAIKKIVSILKQGKNTPAVSKRKFCFFHNFPQHCLEKIADAAVVTTDMDKETKTIIIHNFLK